MGFLTGEIRQGRLGVGWATLSKLNADHSCEATLTITDVDTLTALAAANGPGSVGLRQGWLEDLSRRATPAEASFLSMLIGGELRQGASSGVMADAVAVAADIPAPVLRRATMPGGRLDRTAKLAPHRGSPRRGEDRAGGRSPGCSRCWPPPLPR